MDIDIYNLNFERVAVVDAYDSFIWTDRYNKAGDFELYTTLDLDLFNLIGDGFYIERPGSDRTMIVEKKSIKTSIDEGVKMIIVGRDLSSILDRRIVWGNMHLTGNVQDKIEELLNKTIINPAIADRKIPNFVFKKSSDPYILSETIDAMYTGDNVYEIIETICIDKRIGFRVTLSGTKQFIFELYRGEDRSHAQDENPFVVFSPEFENLLNSEYTHNVETYKTIALVGGEGDGPARKFNTYGGGQGLNRRELFVDARDIQSSKGSVTITTDQYMKLLAARGRNKLALEQAMNQFVGEVDSDRTFIYGKDYFIGDIVQIQNQYGMSSKSMVKEVVYNDTPQKKITAPKFDAVS